MADQVIVLAVDDQPPNLRLLDAILSPRGYRVITASSGGQALELLPSADFDLVLLDIVMPGMDGYDVCRRIRSEPSTAFLPVVMITASGDKRRRELSSPGLTISSTSPSTRASCWRVSPVGSDQEVPRHHYPPGG